MRRNPKLVKLMESEKTTVKGMEQVPNISKEKREMRYLSSLVLAHHQSALEQRLRESMNILLDMMARKDMK